MNDSLLIDSFRHILESVLRESRITRIKGI